MTFLYLVKPAPEIETRERMRMGIYPYQFRKPNRSVAGNKRITNGPMHAWKEALKAAQIRDLATSVYENDSVV